jgi:tripartite-type tricarboxylate transporter receptor subunit TctC
MVTEPYFTMYAPHRTALAFRGRISNDIREVLKVPEVARCLNDSGVDIRGASPEEHHERIKSEYATWEAVIRKIRL